MRSLILILITVAVIGTGLFLYTWMQPTTPTAPVRALGPIKRQQPPAAAPSLHGLQRGESVWIKRYDPKTGELASQFISETYEPQKDGSVHVVKPRSEFFSNDGQQRIRVDGVTGNVVMNLPPEDKSGKMQSNMSGEAPSRGKLQDVIITVFEPADSAEPNLVATMNNASFDNDTFRIATDSYVDDKGNKVEADQVPVKVRGKDYDFDGKGLVIRWNERDRKLQLLEVAHGESLVVKNPSALSKPQLTGGSKHQHGATTEPVSHTGPKPHTEPASRTESLSSTDPLSSAMLASADPGAFVLAVAAPAKKKPGAAAAGASSAVKKRAAKPAAPTSRPKITRDLSPVVYRATFERDVKIFEADKQIVAADRMNIDLLQLQTHDEPATQAADTDDLSPTTKSAKRDRRKSPSSNVSSAPGAAHDKAAAAGDKTAAGAAHSAVDDPESADASAMDDASAGSSSAAKPPTSQPGQQGPITVKWSGSLRVVPLPGTPDPNLVAGKASVQILGTPVVLTREGTEARCGIALYNTADESASLRSTETVPVVTMADSRGAKVTTPQLDYVAGVEQQRLAKLIGPSRADFPVDSETGKPQQASATWKNDCTLRLTDDGAGKVAIEHADLRGDVAVDHPQMHMNADQLALTFDPAPPPRVKPATTPAIGSATASPATAAPPLASASPSTMAAANPAMTSPTTSPAGMPSAQLREVLATGNVKCRIVDPEKQQTIDANTLRVATATTADGQTYAKLVQADGDVRTTENGREMRAGHLIAELAPGVRHPATQPAGATTQAAGDAISKPALGAVAESAGAIAGTAGQANGEATGQATGQATSQPTSRASTKPSSPFGGGDIRLVSLLARDNVTLSTPDGQHASADTLTVESHDGHDEYRLIGKPNATLTDGKSTIVGPAIRMRPDDKIAEIIGAGSLNGHQPEDPKQTIDIAWAGGAVINGQTDWIDVTDKVVVKSTQADGTVSGATSDRLRAKLAPKPATQPTTRSATQAVIQPAAQVAAAPATDSTANQVASTQLASTRATSKPSETDQMNFMAGKEITTATLLGNVHVKSELLAPDGSLARGLDLLADTVTYDRVSGRMEVPVPGSMLYQDHRVGANDGAAAPTVGSGKGKTAFEWKKSLVYDQAQENATLLGDVHVVHHPDGANGQPFDLHSQVLTALFEADRPATKPAADATSPASKPASNPADATAKFHLKRITARDDVHVISTRMNFDAHEFNFDPIAQVLTASGDEANPVVVTDNQSGSTQTASDLEWDTKTDHFKINHVTGKLRK